MSMQEIIDNQYPNIEGHVSPITEGLLRVMLTWNGLPKELVQTHFLDCKEKCGIVYRHYKCYKSICQDKLKVQEDEAQAAYTELQDKYNLLEIRCSELESIHARLSEKHEEVLCNYNALRNKYRRLLIPQVAQLRPRRPVVRNLAFTYPLTTERRKKRKTELGNLLENL
jgi:hypothetical protein